MKAKYKSSFYLKEQELNTVQIELKEREEIFQKQSCELEDKVKECSKLSALSEQLKENSRVPIIYAAGGGPSNFRLAR